MKKATNELANTVIVTVCVAILLAFFYLVLWPMIKENFVMQTSCEKAKCSPKVNAEGLVECKLDNTTFYCKYKG